jgi:hypothetical protein
MAVQFWRRLFDRLKSDTVGFVGKVGLFAVLVTIVSYWISYQDRIANRQNTAWDNLRAAIGWVESPGHWGNAGQIGAIQTLTHDCSSWWRNTLLQPVFELVYHDCVDLNSMSLTYMELGGLQAAGSNFSYSDLSCTNLAQANFRNADLRATKFHGANVAGIDLRGAVLSGDRPDEDAEFALADLSWAQIDQATKIKPAQLKCACIDFTLHPDGKHGPATDRQHVTAPEILAAMRGLKECPDKKCDAATIKTWNCSD